MGGNGESKPIMISLRSLAIFFAIATPLVAWVWNVERRITSVEAAQDLVNRVKTLEDALLPVLVRYKMDDELRKMGILEGAPAEEDEAVPEEEVAMRPPEAPEEEGPPEEARREFKHRVREPSPEERKEIEEKLREEADKWAREKIQQRPMAGH